MRTALLLFLLTFLFTTTSQAQAHLQQEYTRTKLMGLTLQEPLDFDIAPDGKIYVVDHFNIKVFSPEGELLKEHFLDNTYAGFGIATDNQGHFFVSRNGNKVCKYTAEGELVMCFGSTGKAPGQFNKPRGIDLDAQGNIYVADAGNHRVQKFDSQGNILQVYDSLETNTGYFIVPYRIKIDGNNSLNIVGVHWLKRVRQDGTPELLIEGSFIEDVAFDAASNIYLTSVPRRDEQYITKYSHNGDTLATFLSEGTKEGMLSGLYTKLSTDPDNNLWVMEFTPGTLKGRIHKLSPDFDITLTFGNAGSDNKSKVSISHPLRFDGAGNYYSHKSGKLSLFDYNGNHIRTFGGTGELDYFPYLVKDIAFDSQGDLYAIAVGEKNVIHKFRPTGAYVTSLLEQPLLPGGGSFYPEIILFDHADNMYLIRQERCLKYNPAGELIGDIVFHLQTASNGSIFPVHDISIDALGFFFIVQDHHVIKHDQTGAVVAKFEVLAPGRNYESARASVAVDDLGFIYIADRLAIKKYNQSGELVAFIPDRYKLSGNPAIADLRVSGDGSTIRVALKGNSHFNNIIVYQHNNAPAVPNRITGSIYADTNSNCVQEAGEAGVDNIVVMATPGPFYGSTNRYGQYKLEVKPGVYTVKQIIPDQTGRHIQQVCPPAAENYTVDLLETEGATATVNFANQVTLSPHLSVSVSSTRRRRCFESTTTVRYSNSGFATAPDAKVYVQLPAEVGLLSADKAYTRMPDGTYEFAVGDLAAGQRGTITIEDIVTCGDESVRGRTVCTKAWITPGNQSPTGPTRAVSAVSGKCDANTGYVRMVIRNIGQADMETGEQFRIYQDGKLATIENYRLAAGDSMVFRIPAMGRTIRLEADQPAGNGDNILASATVEGCSAAGAPAAFSTGFVNAMPADDEEAEVAEECLPIIDSFDPNDKLVLPTGRTEENYTPTGVPLKYKIRFQNTGTDVAYRVVVADTLSGHLDLSTLQLGAASHNYTYEVSGEGRPVLTWTFHNIMLPDSTSNEPGSHGYIQFSIKPKADLPEKTPIENFADIFFDYNSPVRTNVTVNRIYDMPLEIQEENRILANEVIMMPTIAGFSPAAGKYSSEVSITGAKFSENPGANKIYLNGVLAEVLEGDANALRVRVPAGASTGMVKVVTEHGGATSTKAFTVYQPPVVNSFSPAEGIVGSEVTLQGNYLSAELIERVQLGSQDCEIISTAKHSVTVRVPADAATGTFTVQTKGGTVQSAAAYSVWYAPSLTGFDKAMERVGGRLQLQGQNFAPAPNRNTVLFGNVQAEVLHANAQALEVRVPAGAQSGTVSVTTPGGTASRAFEIIPAPVITEVSPSKGSVGTVVELKGKHFLTLAKQDTVLFSGVAAIVLSASSTSFQVRVPRGAVTGKVRVAGVGGSDEADFEVAQLTPSQAIAVFPNPSTGNFTIDFTRADFIVQAVQVFDTTGKLLYSEARTAGQSEQMEITLLGEKAGVLLVMVHTERGKVVKKVTLL